MTTEERTDHYKAIVRAETARRLLPTELACYANVEAGSVDWLAIAGVADTMSDSDQVLVALTAQLLGMFEAVPYHARRVTFVELLEVVGRGVRVQVLGCLAMLVANLEL